MLNFTEENHSELKLLYCLAGTSALIAFVANVLDVAFGFGSTEVVMYGSKSAVEWFAVFNQSWFKGLYALGILNVVYMMAMIPVYLGMIVAHLKRNTIYMILATMMFIISMSIYISNNAAIPMYVLSNKYLTATPEAQKVVFISAAESILARGEDFTPGSFTGLFLGGVAALILAMAMLKGKIFSRANAWIGIVGFSCLSIFTIVATFVPSLYLFTFYVFGSIGGILALMWFILVALKFFKLSHAQ